MTRRHARQRDSGSAAGISASLSYKRGGTAVAKNRMKTLVICSDPPYGTERWWNGLRLVGA